MNSPHCLSWYCRDNISDPYYPFGEVYSKASWTRELCQPIQITSDDQPANWNCQNIPDYSYPQLRRVGANDLFHPTSKLTYWRRGGGGTRGEWSPGGEEWADSSIETLTEGRCERPVFFLMLGNTGFTSLSDKKQLCQWSTGIAWRGGYCEGHENSLPPRYQEFCMRRGPTQQDRELQCETTEEGTLWLVAHRLIKIQADRNLVARQVSLFPFSVYTPF